MNPRDLRRAWAPALLAIVLCIFLPIGTSHSQLSFASTIEPSWLYTFDGGGAAPAPFRSPDWDVTTHFRSPMDNGPEPVMADHGADCGAPPASHMVTHYEDMVFLCNDHVMTTIQATEYGMIYLTPDRMVDFDQGEAVIRFDLSTLRRSSRDWVDFWIMPFNDNLQLTLQSFLPDAQGPARNAVHIRMDQGFGGNTMFKAAVVRNFAYQDLPFVTDQGYETWLTPDAKRRDTFELRISRTHLRFGMPAYNRYWVDTPIPDLGWSRGVVQFGHHSYNPTKCDGCQPNTWHWDNVQIAPAVPFTLIGGQPRIVNDSLPAAEIHFAQPAPANAHLRFTAFGTNVQVSFDGGTTWQAAQRQAETGSDDWHFHSYWTPIPSGITSVRFRAEGISNWGWHIRDASVWAP